MKRISLLLFYIISCLPIYAQQNTIYSKSYGKSENPAVIFIHGGPSGNATLFEGTTANRLAAKGFYVIAYDRRGEGRSIDTAATFTYREAIKDLNDIYKTYKLKQANIIAHSFGGLVGTLFAEQHPEKVKALILAGALFSQQDTYDHILKSTEAIYTEKKNGAMIAKISETAELAKNSAAYRSQCYEIAGMSGYFDMPYPTKQSEKLREDYQKSEFGKNNIRNQQAPILFYKNETRNNIDVKPVLKALKNQVRLFALYGRQDLIFSEKQLDELETTLGERNLRILDNCSHYLFVDQQKQFIGTIEKWLK